MTVIFVITLNMMFDYIYPIDKTSYIGTAQDNTKLIQNLSERVNFLQKENIKLNKMLDESQGYIIFRYVNDTASQYKITYKNKDRYYIQDLYYDFNISKNKISVDNTTALDLESAINVKLTTLEKRLSYLEGISNSTKSTDNNYTLLNDRFSTIEKIILDDPEKSLSMTLLSRDINDIEIHNQETVENLNSEINDLKVWIKSLIGFILAIVLSIIALAVNNLLKNRGPGS